MKNKATQNVKNLEQVYDELVERGVIVKSRQSTCRTSLRKYAHFLGTTIDKCPPSLFVKSNLERNELIEDGIERTNRNRRTGDKELSYSAVRNIKNDVSFILRKAAEFELIVTNTPLLANWKEARMVLKPQNHRLPTRKESHCSEKYILDPVPKSLEQEFAVYREWCVSEYSPKRPRTLKRKPVSYNLAEDNLLRLAGFLVKFKSFSPDKITLKTLCIPQNVEDFVEWFVNERGKTTSTVTKLCACARTLARYLELTTDDPSEQEFYGKCISGIKSLIGNLSVVGVVRDKSKRWLSLKELDAIGWFYDPYNFENYKHMSCEGARKALKQLKYLETEGKARNPNYPFCGYAKRAAYSLMMRLLVRIPFRQRNLREMAWNPTSPENGKNLYWHEGKWRIRFRGQELKIARKKGKVNTVDFEFPSDLEEILHRYLNLWRPLVINNEKKSHYVDKTCEQQLVFLNAKGDPINIKRINENFSRMTYKSAGVAVNPHMFRTIWATEYIKDTKDPIVAAYMLNDRVETVMENYAELLDPSSADTAADWLEGKLSK
jgi:hypothetical protein